MKILVHENWDDFSTSFYLEYEPYERSEKRVIIGQKDGELVEQVRDMGCTVKISPLVKMPDKMARDFIECIVDYASNKNIKTVNENLMQGKLAATEKHLEDLRSYFAKALDKILEYETKKVIV